MIYRKRNKNKSNFTVSKGLQGEHLERKIERMIANGEPVGTDLVQLIYTARSEGVSPANNIRTDRFEIAVDAATKASKGKAAKRQTALKIASKKDGEGNVGEAKSTDGTKG